MTSVKILQKIPLRLILSVKSTQWKYAGGKIMHNAVQLLVFFFSEKNPAVAAFVSTTTLSRPKLIENIKENSR